MTTQSSTWHGEPSTPPTASQRAVPGTTIGGRYQLRAAIGHGGMGTVWQAADTVLHRDVAVKEVLLPPGIATADRNALYERTMREARAAAALSHPSVVQVYDVVTEGGRPWIIMELLHARSLADMIISDGPLAQRAVAKIGIALLGALEVAHNAGVLHRDVKPANILICTDGRCVLTDFGVARLPSGSTLTTPGMVLGSPHFISPERAVGGAFGPPSDLFSLGVSLYTAIEGHPPFDRGDPFETMRAVVEEPAPQPVRAGALAPVLYGLLEKDPARRWDVPTSRQALRDLLERGQALVDLGGLAVHLGGAAPHGHQAVAAVGLGEGLDVDRELLGQVPLGRAVLDVVAVQVLHVGLLEHRGHRMADAAGEAVVDRRTDGACRRAGERQQEPQQDGQREDDAADALEEDHRAFPQADQQVARLREAVRRQFQQQGVLALVAPPLLPW